MPLSTYSRNKVLNILRNTTFTGLSNTYVSLHTSDPTIAGTAATEVKTNGTPGDGYARQTVSSAQWDVPDVVGSDAFTDTNIDLTFGPCTTNAWGAGANVAYFGVWDAATSGNLLWFGTCSSKAIGVGDSYKFTSGNLDLLLR